MAEELVLDPAEEAADRVEVDITEFVALDGVDWGDAEAQQFMAEGAYGSSPVDHQVANRIVSMPLRLRDRGAVSFEEARRALQAKVALFQREGGVLKRVVSNGGTIYADIRNAALRLGGGWGQSRGRYDEDAVLTLECLPDWYGAEVALEAREETDLPELIFAEATRPDPETTTFAITDGGGLNPHWMAADGTLFAGAGGASANLRWSTDDGATWTTHSHTFPLNVQTVRDLEDGELLVFVGGSGTQAEIWKSSGWAANRVTATFAEVHQTHASGCYFANSWSISVYDNHVLAAEYGNKLGGADNARYVFHSDDYGDTWSTIYDRGEGVGHHLHGVCYDQYWDRIWVSFGDDTNGIVFSDDFGATWKLADYGSSTSSPNQAVGIIAMPECVLFASDAAPNGVLKFDRSLGRDVTWPLAPTVELISNGDFEADTSGWTGGAGSPGATLTRVTSEQHSGAASLKVDWAGGGSTGGAWTFASVDVDPSTRYLATFWVKGAAGGEALRINLVERDAADAIIAQSFVNFTATTDWEQVSVERLFSSTGVKARVAIQAQSGSTAAYSAYVDGVSLGVKRSVIESAYRLDDATTLTWLGHLPFWTGNVGDPVLFTFVPELATEASRVIATLDGERFYELWRDSITYTSQGIVTLLGPTPSGKLIGTSNDGRQVSYSRLTGEAPDWFPAIRGDYPARLRLVIDELDDEEQNELLWGVRSRYYSADSTAALAYQAEELTPTSPAAVATRALASGGAADNVVNYTDLPIRDDSNPWTEILTTALSGAELSHMGTYRVWARIFLLATHKLWLRFAWQVGELGSGVTTNSPVTVDGTNGFYLVDLGEISLRPTGSGDHSWQGRIEAVGAAGGEDVEIDRVYFQPLDEAAGRLTGSPALGPSRTLELRTEGAFYETPGGSYSPVPYVRGDLPRLPVGGLENRTVEVFIKAVRAGQPITDSVLIDNGVDDIRAQVFLRPCWLFMPSGS
ncbi:MAG TPA: carbohydrate binding domain-containing protein [Thermoleophilaceae bacterium]|nr:carbohydrate binding domain-containing protein [Thermoleophilaceae bacterium]